jgi:hypothetical protein
MDTYYRNLFLEFDGFVSYDVKSNFSLWSLTNILAMQELSTRISGDRYFAIGDFLINSDFIMCCLERESAYVFFRYEGTELSTTGSDFMKKLINGDFDILE